MRPGLCVPISDSTNPVASGNLLNSASTSPPGFLATLWWSLCALPTRFLTRTEYRGWRQRKCLPRSILLGILEGRGDVADPLPRVTGRRFDVDPTPGKPPVALSRISFPTPQIANQTPGKLPAALLRISFPAQQLVEPQGKMAHSSNPGVHLPE